MTTEAKTGLTQWSAGATQPDLLFNALLRHYAASGFRCSVLDKDLTTPPTLTTSDAGNSYIVAATATGVWTGHETHIAYWDGISWWYFVPQEGDRQAVLDENTDYRFDGSAWVDAGTALGTVALANGGTGASLADPGADRIMFWDDSAGAVTWLTLGTNLSITGTTLDASGGAGSVTSVNGDTGAAIVTAPIIIACSDETTALTTGTAKVTFRMPYAMTLTEVPRASLTTAQGSGSIFTVDINEGGTSILSTKLTIDNTEKTSTTAATPAVLSDSALANDAEITIDIDQIGNGTAAGLKVTLIGYAS